MLERFASACLVASIAVAVAAIVVLIYPGLTLAQASAVLIVWCIAPMIWGVWAMITPQSWMPNRMPLWGAILGAFAAIMGAFVLNLPSRVLGWPIPVALRAFGAVVMVAFYFAMWSIVATVHKKLLSVSNTQEQRQVEYRLK